MKSQMTGLLLLCAVIPCQADTIGWRKIQIDKSFRSEGVAAADVNKDGKVDILAGDVWYEAPDWKRHEIRPVGNYGDGSRGYSNSFACFADDFNKDGWPDVLIIGFPGAPCHWYENPKNKPGHWPAHVVWHSACNETPLYEDLFGNGQKVLIMGWQPKGSKKGNQGQMAWFCPGKDPTSLWEMHPISEPSTKNKEIPGTRRFSHGLGVGDINGDGRADVICTGGWWEQPAKVTDEPWSFHPADLGPACADMFALDIDGDKRPDVISSSAHNYGIWWHRQIASRPHPQFQRRDLFKNLFSQSHALRLVDLDGDGDLDLVTGKRWWAHGPKGDVAPNDPAVLYWFENRRGKDGVVAFVPHQIDDDSGIGTQFTVVDVNGDKLPDIVVANKKGVYLHLQARK
ncbi:MAG: hypothetical protein KatS3mg105_4350 [Gemmatales bacterium]|nr:MAG: hypothetical protein KatS3mg105_4350 [Gemmatales bacterium]